MSKKHTGERGEDIAAWHLQGKGYNIVARNWQCTRGELDIIATKDEVLVFVEVRTRHAPNTEAALISITPRKRERLIASAYTYIEEQALDNPLWRIDVVAVALPRYGQPIIEHVEDALGW